MPNWCYNYLSVDGPADEVAKLKTKLSQPFTKMHDQWNPATHQMELVETAYSNPVFAFHNIYNHIEDGVSEEEYMKQPDHKLGEPIRFDGNHWYDWNVRNWGTKWDVGIHDKDEYPETEITDESNTSIAYRFNTAWSPPMPAIEKLVEQYPKLNFNLSYEEETGWGGEVSWEEGILIESTEYENKCRDCDSENTLDYCENECGEICDSCHYLGEADLEAVAECEVHKVYLDKDHVPDYRMDEVNA